MTDNQIYAIMFPLITAGLTKRGVANVTVLQSYQPTQQGAASGRSVYLFSLHDDPVGFVRRDSVYDTVDAQMRATELQTWTGTYQVNALAIQEPGDITGLTAKDIVKAVRQTLQSSDTIGTLRSSGLAILRIGQLNNPTFTDDKGRFEYSPSFDFVLTYDEKYTDDAPVVEFVEYDIKRV
jgi:hypothetical protein